MPPYDIVLFIRDVNFIVKTEESLISFLFSFFPYEIVSERTISFYEKLSQYLETFFSSPHPLPHTHTKIKSYEFIEKKRKTEKNKIILAKYNENGMNSIANS